MDNRTNLAVWEMTQEEYVATVIEDEDDKNMNEADLQYPSWNKKVIHREIHAEVIEHAIIDGKKVPGRVLRDYPTLRRKYFAPDKKRND